MVGQTGRRQAITLASGCWTNGIVAHEIGKFYRLRESFPVPYGRGTGHNRPFDSNLPSVYFRSREKWFLFAGADFPFRKQAFRNGQCHTSSP